MLQSPLASTALGADLLTLALTGFAARGTFAVVRFLNFSGRFGHQFNPHPIICQLCAKSGVPDRIIYLYRFCVGTPDVPPLACLRKTAYHIVNQYVKAFFSAAERPWGSGNLSTMGISEKRLSLSCVPKFVKRGGIETEAVLLGGFSGEHSSRRALGIRRR